MRSVQEQSYRDWELLACVDPLSKDSSVAIVKSFAAHDRRIKIVYSSRAGPAAVRNHGLEHAQGRWLSFLDADDLWLPRKLDLQQAFLKRRKAALTATGYRRVTADGTCAGRLLGLAKPRLQYGDLLKQNNILCSSVMLDLARTGKIFFPETGCEDFALWLELTRRGLDCEIVPRDLVRYRITPGSFGSSKWKSARESWQLLRAHQGTMGALHGFPGFLWRGFLKHRRF